MSEEQAKYFVTYSVDDSKPVTYSHNIGETLRHKMQVSGNISTVVTELIKRATIHDFSKLSEAENDHFQKTLPKLEFLTYGTQEYKDTLKDIQPALDHHYSTNTHHPEYHENGVKDMTLLDLIEMLCDWKAATMRHRDGDLRKSLQINKERFGMSDEMYNILVNTARELGFISEGEI